MKIYLAARYSRHPEMQEYRDRLEASGHTVTSRWINGGHQISDEGMSEQSPAVERERFATEDYSDLIAADLVVSFTEPPRSTNSRGGRHVEFGIALGLGRTNIVIGPRENVFHCLPSVEVFETFDDFFKEL